jgi:hypothetical protein
MLTLTFLPSSLPLYPSLEEVQQLVKDFIEEQLTDNPSTPIMYMLVESVREWLLSNNVKGDDGSAWSSMMKREAAKKKEEEGKAKSRLRLQK